jgi:Mrp family chromosome partitioning ATPase
MDGCPSAGSAASSPARIATGDRVTDPRSMSAAAPSGVTAPRLRQLDWHAWRTPFVFFTGKGGVGKTTIAGAAAVALSDAGDRVLLVSTDPASNLGDLFGTPVAAAPGDVPGVPGLEVMNLDPEAAARGTASA